MYACLAGSSPQRSDERLNNDNVVPATKAVAGQYSPHFLVHHRLVPAASTAEAPQSCFACRRFRPTSPEARPSKKPGSKGRTPVPQNNGPCVRFTIFQESRVGKRRTNQDRVAYSCTRDALLLVLADGMGGHLCGVRSPRRSRCSSSPSPSSRRSAQGPTRSTCFSSGASNAHHAIPTTPSTSSCPDVPRTTIVACLIQEGVAHWAHAGDSPGST